MRRERFGERSRGKKCRKLERSVKIEMRETLDGKEFIEISGARVMGRGKESKRELMKRDEESE